MNLCLNKSTSKTRQSTKSAEKECVHVTLYKAQIKKEPYLSIHCLAVFRLLTMQQVPILIR